MGSRCEPSPNCRKHRMRLPERQVTVTPAFAVRQKPVMISATDHPSRSCPRTMQSKIIASLQVLPQQVYNGRHIEHGRNSSVIAGRMTWRHFGRHTGRGKSQHLTSPDKTSLAELGRYPLQIHFWQHILRFHNKLLRLGSWKLAVFASYGCDDEASALRPQLSAFFDTQPGRLHTCSPVDVTDIVERKKERHRAAFLASDLRSVTSYKSFHPAHAYAQYLSSVRCLVTKYSVCNKFRTVELGIWVAYTAAYCPCAVCAHCLTMISNMQGLDCSY